MKQTPGLTYWDRMTTVIDSKLCVSHLMCRPETKCDSNVGATMLNMHCVHRYRKSCCFFFLFVKQRKPAPTGGSSAPVNTSNKLLAWCYIFLSVFCLLWFYFTFYVLKFVPGQSIAIICHVKWNKIQINTYIEQMQCWY